MGLLPHGRHFAPHGHFAPLSPNNIFAWAFCPTPPGLSTPHPWAFCPTPIGVAQNAHFSFICCYSCNIHKEGLLSVYFESLTATYYLQF